MVKFLDPLAVLDDACLWNSLRVPSGLLSDWARYSPFDAEYVHDVSGRFLFMSKTFFDTFHADIRKHLSGGSLGYDRFNAWEHMLAYRPIVQHHLEEIQRAIDGLIGRPRPGASVEGAKTRENTDSLVTISKNPRTFLVRGLARSTMYQSEIYGAVVDPASLPEKTRYVEYILPAQNAATPTAAHVRSRLVSEAPTTPLRGRVYALAECHGRPTKRVEYAPELIAVRIDGHLELPSVVSESDRAILERLRDMYPDAENDAGGDGDTFEGTNVLSVRYESGEGERIARWLLLIRGRASIVAPSGEQFDHSPTGNVVFDLHGRVLDINRRALEVFAGLRATASVGDLRDLRIRLLNDAPRFYEFPEVAATEAAPEVGGLLTVYHYMPDPRQRDLVRRKIRDTKDLLKSPIVGPGIGAEDQTRKVDEVLNELRARDELLYLHLTRPGSRRTHPDPFVDRTYAVSIALHEVENETPKQLRLYEFGAQEPQHPIGQPRGLPRRKSIRTYVARMNEPRLETAQRLVGAIGSSGWVDLERSRVVWLAFGEAARLAGKGEPVNWSRLRAQQRTTARIDIVQALEDPWTMPLVVMAADLGAYGELTRALVDSPSPSGGGMRDNEEALRWFQQAFMTLATRVIHRHKGIVVKFAGDGVLAAFGVDEAIATRWRMRGLEAIELDPEEETTEYNRFGSVRVAPLRALLAARALTSEYEGLRAELIKVMDATLPAVRHRPREGIRVGLTLGWCLAGIFDPAFGDLSPIDTGAASRTRYDGEAPLPSNAMIDLFGRPVNVAARAIELSRNMFWHARNEDPVEDSKRVLCSTDIVVDHCFRLRCERLMRGDAEGFVRADFTPLVPGRAFNLKHDDTAVDFYRVDPASISAPPRKNRDAFSLWHSDWMSDAAVRLEVALDEALGLRWGSDDRDFTDVVRPDTCPSWQRLGMLPDLVGFLRAGGGVPTPGKRIFASADDDGFLALKALVDGLREELRKRHTETSADQFIDVSLARPTTDPGTRRARPPRRRRGR